MVSPGLTEEVVAASRHHNITTLPGVATASDIMRGLCLGLKIFKFFPAETSGGAPAIKALGGPFPQVSFCSTGGNSTKNLASYLSGPNVIAAGGSWMVPPDLHDGDAFTRTTEMAREARTLSATKLPAIEAVSFGYRFPRAGGYKGAAKRVRMALSGNIG